MNTRHMLGSAAALAACLVIGGALPRLVVAQAGAPKSEPELIALLRSDAPEADKALACKHLSVYGSTACVGDLAKLLGNERLASWARIALEVIPGAEVDEALRKATESLEGRLLVGVINSIGVRRDSEAVNLLATRLQDKDADVAAAAAVALGRIGTEAAASPLRKALAGGAPLGVRSAIAEGCILCAERALAAGNAAEATKIYDEVRAAEVPRQRMLEATRGAILARGKEGIPLLVEQLRSNDKGLFQIGLMTAREVPGRELDQALAAELERAFPERAALILTAMADRRATVELAAIVKAAGSGHKLPRLAALAALGRVGNASCVAPLLETALDADAELAQAAKEALAALPDQAADQEIVTRLATAEGKTQLLLIELVGLRHIEATESLLKALGRSDRAARTAALTALGNTVSQKYLPVLVNHVLSSTSSDDADVALAALKTAAVRMPDREACASELVAALDRAPAATKIALLEILGAVGGTKALAAVGAVAKSSDPTLQDVGSRLLGDWQSPDAAPVLLSLAKGGGRYQNRALRGYIGMAQKLVMPEEQRLEMCRNALDLAQQPNEQKLVLDVLKRYPSLETLKLAVETARLPGLRQDAAAAAEAIAQKLPKTSEVQSLVSQAKAGK